MKLSRFGQVLALLLLLPSVMLGQGSRKDDIVIRSTAGFGGASIRVCTAAATGTPCSPLASLFSNVSLTTVLTNPITADSNGNYNFYAAPGRYVIQVTSGTSTFQMADVVIPPDVTGPVTWSGNQTFTGNLTAGNIDKVLHVNAGGQYTTIALALAACPAAPNGCHIITDDGVSLTSVPAFTLGVASCQNSFVQVLELGVNTSLSLAGNITLLCGGYIYGQNRDGSVIIAGGSFPVSTPLVDMGDNINLIDARVEGLKLNCNLVAGCTGIRGRGLNENSFIGRNLIQNYLVNGIALDGTTVSSGNFRVEENQVLGATGAGDAIVSTNIQSVTFNRNTEASNSGVQISGAGIHFLGTLTTGPNIVSNNHVEKHTDNILLDGKNSLAVSNTNNTNGATNVIHVAGAATGSIVAVQSQGNGNSAGFPVILNDVTTTNLASTNPPAPNGVIPFYQWQNGFMEKWTDALGDHLNKQIISTLVTGTAPFSIASTTPVANLTVQNLTGPGAISGSFSGNPTLTGNLTATAGQNLINANSLNGHFWTGPGATPTIDTAIASAVAAGGGVVDIAPNYSGAEAATCASVDGLTQWNGPANVTAVDWRTGGSACGYPLAINSAQQGALSASSIYRRFTSPASTTSAQIVTGQFTGNLSAGAGNLEALTVETDLTGALTAAPTASVGGIDSEVSIRSTTQTIPDLIAISGRVQIDRAGASTNVTRATGLRGVGCGSNVGTGSFVECYAVRAERQTLGTSRNYSVFSMGRTRYGFFSGDNGFDLESTSGTPLNVFENDGTDAIVYRPLGDAQGILFRNRAKTATYLRVIPSNNGPEVNRIKANLGTAYSGADAAIVLSAGWGNTAAASACTGFDQDWTCTITANGTGIALNPTITNIFKDGTWTVAPGCKLTWASGTSVLVDFAETTPSATAPVYTALFTPTAGQTTVVHSSCGGR